jgi:hypothetical protein
MTLTPRQKLLGAAGAALAVPVLAALSGGSATGAARMVLGTAAVIGLVAWLWRARGSSVGGFRAAPRLKVVQRVGLSGRSALALVEIDGRPWLVAHGDGYARLRPVPRPRRVGASASAAAVTGSSSPNASVTGPVYVPRVAEPSPALCASAPAPNGVRTPAGGDALRPSTRATRSPVPLAHLRLQDPLEDCYVASLVPPRPSAPVLSLRRAVRS